MYGQRSGNVIVVCTVNTDIEQEMGKTAWTLTSWNSSFSPQSVTLAPHVAYWALHLSKIYIIARRISGLFWRLGKGACSLIPPSFPQTSFSLDLSPLWPFTSLTAFHSSSSLFFYLLSFLPFPSFFLFFFSQKSQQLVMWLWTMARLWGLQQGATATGQVWRGCKFL